MGEIQSYLDSGMDIFKRKRVLLAFVQAQLADDRVHDALESSKQLDTETLKVEFLFAYAKRLLANGKAHDAKVQLFEIDRLLAVDDSPFDRLRQTGQSQRLAKALAQLGEKDRARAILDNIISVRKQIPLNPMLLSLSLQISQTQVEIGVSDAAAFTISDTYEMVLDQGVEVMPEQALLIFESWSSLDPVPATKAAEELIEIVRQDGPSAFEFGVWTGLARGMNTSDPKAAGMVDRAKSSFSAAPEREAVMLLLPKLAVRLKNAGQREEGLTLLNTALAEAETISSPMEKAQILLSLAQAYGEMEANDQAKSILRELVLMVGNNRDGMLKHIMMGIPAQLALLGEFDEAYRLAVESQSGSQQMALIMAADKIAMQGNYNQAMRFVRQINDEMAAMLMAGIADRLHDAQSKKGLP